MNSLQLITRTLGESKLAKLKFFTNHKFWSWMYRLNTLTYIFLNCGFHIRTRGSYTFSLLESFTRTIFSFIFFLYSGLLRFHNPIIREFRFWWLPGYLSSHDCLNQDSMAALCCPSRRWHPGHRTLASRGEFMWWKFHHETHSMNDVENLNLTSTWSLMATSV